MGNLLWSDTPRHFRTWYHKDGIGRDTLVLIPIDASHRKSERVFDDIMSNIARGVGRGSGGTRAVTSETQAVRRRDATSASTNLRTALI